MQWLVSAVMLLNIAYGLAQPSAPAPGEAPASNSTSNSSSNATAAQDAIDGRCGTDPFNQKEYGKCKIPSYCCSPATVAQVMPIALAVRSLVDTAKSNVMRTRSSVDQAVLPLLRLPSYPCW